jgi:hypothetical protein
MTAVAAAPAPRLVRLEHTLEPSQYALIEAALDLSSTTRQLQPRTVEATVRQRTSSIHERLELKLF